MKKMISLLLCAVMVLGMLPVLPVSAATVKTEQEVLVASSDENGRAHGSWTTVTKEYKTPDLPTVPTTPIQKRTVSTNEYGELVFENLEDLKEIAADTYAEWTFANYMGTGDLVITEDLKLPANLTIIAWDYTILVPENVTLTVPDLLVANNLIVEGTLYATSFSIGGLLQISGDAWVDYGTALNVEVTGKLYMVDSLYMTPGGTITGKENIAFEYEWAGYEFQYKVVDWAGVEEAIAAANASTDSRESFGIIFYNEETLTLTQSLKIPSTISYINTRNSAGLTVAEGAALELEPTSFALMCPMTIHGALVNNGDFTIQYNEGGLLTFAAGSTYSGSGYLSIYCDTETNYLDAVPGLDMTNIQATEYSEYIHYWELKNMEGLTQLGTPTDLKWGYSLEWHWDAETESSYTTLEENLPGSASWKTALPDENTAKVEFFRVNGDTDERWTGTTHWFGSMEHEEYRAVDQFLLSDPVSGDYYFTVTSIADGTQYCNSDTSVSDIWTYVKPDAQLSACSNLVWDGYNEVYGTITHSWDGPAEEGYVAFYEKEYYFAAAEDAEPRHIGTSWGGTADTTDHPWEGLFQENGAGYYYFRVRAISADLTKYCNGLWSDLSPAYNVTELPENIEDQLDNIIYDSSLSAEEKLEAVKNLDSEKLEAALLNSPIVTGQLVTLEQEAAGGMASVVVTEEAAAFDDSQVTVVGANLNTTIDDTKGVTLVIDKPEQEHVIPEAYNNSVAVSFSMNLENVADTENLEVPVKITLPIPTTINPDFLVILHYHADGTVEEIWPSIVGDYAPYFASFVLTGFSDFVMTEIKTEVEIPGDLNADGNVDESDVAQLLWHTLFPDSYEISGDADFNGDGATDESDVAYLLWHTLFPDSYPLT